MKKLSVLLSFLLLALQANVPNAQMLQAIVVGQSMASPCALPFTDTFSGTGALNSCWISPVSANWGGTVTRLSGYAAWTSGTGNAMALYTGTSPAAQSITLVAHVISHGAGPVLRGNSANGNGYWWIVNSNTINYLTSGVGYSTSATCPTVSAGDVITFSVDSSFNFTCKNVSTSTTNTWTDSSVIYSSGKPGVFFVSNLDLIGTSVISSP